MKFDTECMVEEPCLGSRWETGTCPPWATAAFVVQCFAQTLIQHDVMTPSSLCVRGFKEAAAFPKTYREGGRKQQIIISNNWRKKHKLLWKLMINFSVCRLEKGENQKPCLFLQALRKDRVRHCRDKGTFQIAAAPATLKVLADH